MASEVPETRLVENQSFAFKPGIDVVPASEIKGLEFDYVVIVEASATHWPDTPHHRRLMHVAATQAVHHSPAHLRGDAKLHPSRRVKVTDAILARLESGGLEQLTTLAIDHLLSVPRRW